MKIPAISPTSQTEVNYQTSTSSTVTVTNSLTATKPSSMELRPETLESSSTSRILPSPATLHAITKEIENSFKESSSLESPNSPPSSSNISHRFTGSLSKISNAQPYQQPQQHKTSPSNSVKSNSAPGRVSSMDPQLTMSINKVTQGNFCVKPQDELGNRGEGNNHESERKKSTTTIEDVERLSRMRSEIYSGERLKFPGIGSNSLGNDTRYRSETTLQQERRKSAGDEDVLKLLNVNVSLIFETNYNFFNFVRFE